MDKGGGVSVDNSSENKTSTSNSAKGKSPTRKKLQILHLSQKSVKMVYQIKICGFNLFCVKYKRQNLHHILSNDIKMECVPTTVGNSYNIFETVVGGNTQKGWDLVFDFFLKTKKLSKKTILISLALLRQTNRKRNIIMCLIQQYKWLMARSMIHQGENKTRRKATIIT